MRLIITSFLLLISLSSSAWAQEPATAPVADPNAINVTPQGREPQSARDVAYPDFSRTRNDNSSHNPYGHDGIRVNIYYDPISSYSKINLNQAYASNQFTYQTTTGAMSGIQAMWSVWAPSDLEFQSGIDYLFPLSIQGQQATYSNFTVNSQTLNVIGLKILQAGYRFYFDKFTLAPYGGIGVYYGKNNLLMTNYSSGGLQDNVEYSKLMAVYTAGARLDYSFNRDRTFAAGLGFEFFVPTKLADQLSQSGSSALTGTSSELSGQSSYFQSNMDFMTGVGARLYASVAAYF